MAKKIKHGVKWEMFEDASYFHLWAVRPVGDHDFNSPRLFHFFEQKDALSFYELFKKSYHAIKG